MDSISNLYEKIIINGDFNFPKISSSENLVIPSGEDERIFYNALSDHYLSQLVVGSPSRKLNVLDLLITSIPDNIANIDLIDPKTFSLYSDHKCVFFDFNEVECPPQKITKTVYDYNRANFNEMNWTSKEIVFEFMSTDSVYNINDDWTLWRGTFLATADNFIPKKHTKKKIPSAVVNG